MEYIKKNLSQDTAKKIIGNSDNAKKYLKKFNNVKTILGLEFRTVTRGKRAGQEVLDLSTNELWKLIVDTWDYDISKKIIRELFKETLKYKNGKEANEVMNVLFKEWEAQKLGNISWPFSQGDFDGFVQRVNSESAEGVEKDEKVKTAAVKYRRIKEINTVRNDFIETLIFEKNSNIIPTLSHHRGVDFYIDGISFDQKVAKSPTREFIRDFNDDWRKKAIENPGLVAEYLYRKQDEGRFGADPRLLVVYLDEDIKIEKIKSILDSINLNEPLEISFTYNHRVQGEKSYKVQCFVILLHN